MNASIWTAFDRTGFDVARLAMSALWQSSILLAAAGLLVRLLRGRHAAIRHAIVAAAVLASPAVPLVSLALARAGAPHAPIAVMPAYEPAMPTVVTYSRLGAENADFQASPPPPAQPVAKKITLADYPWAIALAGYAAGLAGLLSLIALGRLRIGRWVRRGHIVTEPRVLEILAAAQERLRVGGRILIVESDRCLSPMTAGSLHPVILLPTGLVEQTSDADLAAIALHELAHIRRHDSLMLLALSLVRAVFFFHPLIWLACRQSARLAETACDDAVLEVTGQPVGYAKMLVRLAEQLPARAPVIELAAGIVWSKSAFIRRVETILSDRRSQLRRLSRLGLAATVLMAGLSLALAQALPLTQKPAAGVLAASTPAASQGSGEFTVTTTTVNGRLVDKLDYPFRDDPAVIGKWTSVDFVPQIAAFKPGKKQFRGDLFLKELTFLPNGRMAQPWYTWTKGLVLHSGDQTAAHYTIQHIGNADYLFFEWKSGDYSLLHQKPSYYVLKREAGAPTDLAAGWANMPSDEQWRKEFPAKLAKLDLDTADLDQLKAAFGPPGQYLWGQQTWPASTPAADLPQRFIAQYPDGVSVFLDSGGRHIVELRFEHHPGYFYADKIQVGSSLADVLAVVGPPTRTVAGGTLGFEDGVLYKNCQMPNGEQVGYYARADKHVRFFFQDDKVAAVYITAAERPTTRPRALDPADRATAPAASQPAAPKAAPAAAKDRFEATLANGVTVELIGLSRGPSQQDSWWRPDGKPLAKAPSFTGAGRSSAGEGQRYEVALEWRHLPADNAVRWEFLPCTSSSWSDNGPKEGNDITNSMAAAVSVPAWTVRATIRCGAAAGAWTTVVPAQPGGAMTTSDATGRAIAFAPAAQTGKDAALTVAHNVLDQDVRVVAVDKKGRTITSTKATGGSAGGKIVQTTFTFSNVAIDDIEKFNFQVRPFEWVEFSNVALQEGLETDVKTVLEKAGSDAQKSRPLDGNSF